METANPTLQQKKVRTALRWSEEQYADFMYNCGLAYLQFYIGNEPQEVLSHIRKSKTFWNWWKLHWQKRDEEFFQKWKEEVIDGNCNAGLEWLEIYFEYHDPKTLAAEIYPSGVVLGESYATMIDQLNKEAVA
jgi:hypothetical protein